MLHLMGRETESSAMSMERHGSVYASSLLQGLPILWVLLTSLLAITTTAITMDSVLVLELDH